MQTVIRTPATVLPGHRLEITLPELPEGQTVEVIVLVQEAPAQKKMSMLEFLESRPPRPPLFKTAEEVNQYIQEERDSWER